MLEVTQFLLMCLGLTLILTKSKIFRPFREWTKNKDSLFYDLINCPLCTGFWVGYFGAFWTSYSLLSGALMSAAVCGVTYWALADSIEKH